MENDFEKELIRKSIHLLAGSVLAALIYFDVLTVLYLLIFLIVSSSLMFFVYKTKKRVIIISDILDVVSREKEFPGYGALTLLLGSLISFVLFSKEVAVASILILAIGDSVSHVIGRSFGKTKTFLSKTKLLEGFIVGVVLSVLAITPIVGIILAFFSSLISLLLEFWDKTNFIDDNILIPLVAGTVMTILKLYL